MCDLTAHLAHTLLINNANSPLVLYFTTIEKQLSDE